MERVDVIEALDLILPKDGATEGAMTVMYVPRVPVPYDAVETRFREDQSALNVVGLALVNFIRIASGRRPRCR